MPVYLPLLPEPLEQEPDLSFRATTHDAFARHLRYGRDIVSTYGPWGILQRGHDRRTAAAVMTASALLALVFVFGGLRILRDAGVGWTAAGVWTAAAAVILFAARGDARFTAIGLLLALSLLLPPRNDRELPLVAALGLVALIKMSLLLLAVFLVALACLIRRRFAHAAFFIASALAFWLAAGQRVGDIAAFVRGGLAVSGGYAGASNVGGAYASAALVAVALAAMAVLTEREPLRVCLLAGFAAYLLEVGFTRADLPHTAPANAIFLLLTGALLFLRRERFGSIGPLVAAIGATAVALSAASGLPAFADHIATIVRHDRRELPARTDSLPLLSGTIDAYPWGSAALIARGDDYVPRPIFQSCMAWTAALAQRNAEHLRAHPPDWIWAGVGSIDGRYPLLDDAPSWLEIARRYDVAQSAPGHLLLKRRASPRSLTSSTSSSVTPRFGDSVDVPAGLAWCAIEVHPGLFNRLRPSMLTLETFDEAGRRATWRLAPAQVAGGFLISPAVTDAGELATLIAAGRGRAIRRMRLLGLGFGERYLLTFARATIDHAS